MSAHATDGELERLFRQGLGLGPDRKEALWADFAQRAAREAEAWAAFAMVMSLYGRRLSAVLAGSGR